MAQHEQVLDKVLDKLVRDVEMAVHALYRGDVRQNTAKARTEVHRQSARDALAALVASGGAPLAADTPVTGAMPTEAELGAITRCIMAWLPMGAPNSASPESRCVPAVRELIPTWAERETARAAVKRMHG